MSILVDVIKAIHVTAGISLIAFIIFELTLLCKKQSFLISHQTLLAQVMPKIERFGMIALTIAIIGGTLLVPLRHYAYTTPWIEAAYMAMVICGGAFRFHLFFKSKNI